MRGFAEELQLASAEGVVRTENLPFLLEPSDRTDAPAVLLVHGFSASPWELRELGEDLTARGFRVLGVRLPGHGTTPEDLAHRDWEEWRAAVERGWGLLASASGRVYGVGMSTGALLLLELALRRDLAGLVLLSPFLRLRHPLAAAAGLLRHLYPFQRRPVAKEAEPFYYARRPLRGVQQIHRLIRALRPRLGRLTVPVLVIGAAQDATVRPGSALTLFRRLGSRDRQFHLLGADFAHVLTDRQNPRRQEVFELAGEFMRNREEALRPSGGRKASGSGAASLPGDRSCR